MASAGFILGGTERLDASTVYKVSKRSRGRVNCLQAAST